MLFVLFIVLTVLVRPLYFIVLVRPLYIHSPGSSGSFSLCSHCSGCLFLAAFTFIVLVLVLTFIVVVQYRILLLLCSL